MRRVSCYYGMLWGLLVLWFGFWCEKQTSARAEVMRPYNLDYLDIETMEYYLQAPKHEYDIAVLFYAQWCKNCHAFAPIWDKISRLIHAGSKDSNMIMALFDCEHDFEHQEVCNKAGIKHYPTITFYSLSGQEFHRKQKKTKKNPYPMPQHSIRFSGNWQYGDAVYDWLRAMSGLSGWHRAGWGRKIRSLFTKTDNNKKTLKQQIPLGIPPSGGGGTTQKTSSSRTGTTTAKESAGSASSSASSKNSEAIAMAAAEKKVENLQTAMSKLDDIVTRSGIMLGSILHPVTVRKTVSSRVAANQTLATCTLREDHGKNYTDAYQFLAETGGWSSTSTAAKKKNAASTMADMDDEEEYILLLEIEDLVLRTCVMEISLDYCSRVTTQVTLDWIDKNENDLSDEVLATLEDDLMKALETAEPYCILIESCVQQDFNATECRPATCPFLDPTACRYVSTCFEPEIYAEYAKALQVNTTTAAKTAQASSFPKSRSPEKKRGWGFF